MKIKKKIKVEDWIIEKTVCHLCSTEIEWINIFNVSFDNNYAQLGMSRGTQQIRDLCYSCAVMVLRGLNKMGLNMGSFKMNESVGYDVYVRSDDNTRMKK